MTSVTWETRSNSCANKACVRRNDCVIDRASSVADFFAAFVAINDDATFDAGKLFFLGDVVVGLDFMLLLLFHRKKSKTKNLKPTTEVAFRFYFSF